MYRGQRAYVKRAEAAARQRRPEPEPRSRWRFGASRIESQCARSKLLSLRVLLLYQASEPVVTVRLLS